MSRVTLELCWQQTDKTFCLISSFNHTFSWRHKSWYFQWVTLWKIRFILCRPAFVVFCVARGEVKSLKQPLDYFINIIVNLFTLIVWHLIFANCKGRWICKRLSIQIHFAISGLSSSPLGGGAFTSSNTKCPVCQGPFVSPKVRNIFSFLTNIFDFVINIFTQYKTFLTRSWKYVWLYNSWN